MSRKNIIQFYPLFKCFPCIPKRFIVMLFLMTGFAVCFIFRLCIVLFIANYIKTDKKPPPLSHSCKYSGPTKAPENKNYFFFWPQYGVGHALAAYYYGYAAGLFLNGILADRYGGKILMAIGVALSSIITLLTPFGFKLGFIGIVMLRVPFGYFQSMVTIPLYVQVVWWIPREERGTWLTVAFCGTMLGNVLNSLITPNLFHLLGPHYMYVFLIYSLVGLLWTLLFVIFCGSDPDHDPFLSQKERDRLEDNMILQRKRYDRRIHVRQPWKYIFTSAPMWTLLIASFGYHYYVFGITNQLPIFLKVIYHMDITIVGYSLMGMAAVELIISILGGILVDYIERKKLLSTTRNRKIFYGITVFFPTCSMMAPLIGCKPVVVTSLMLIGIAMGGVYYASLKVNCVDFAPRYSGTVTGFIHTVAMTGGIFSNTVFGYIVPRNYLSEWQINFAQIGAVYVALAIPWFIFGSGEISKWNDFEGNEHIKEIPPNEESGKKTETPAKVEPVKK